MPRVHVGWRDVLAAKIVAAWAGQCAAKDVQGRRALLAWGRGMELLQALQALVAAQVAALLVLEPEVVLAAVGSDSGSAQLMGSRV